MGRNGGHWFAGWSFSTDELTSMLHRRKHWEGAGMTKGRSRGKDHGFVTTGKARQVSGAWLLSLKVMAGFNSGVEEDRS